MGKESRNKNRYLRVGITGSLASGKSTVLKAFKKQGFLTASADDLVAQIYVEEKIDKQKLIEKFGKSMSGLKRLEGWIHPKVEKKVMRLVAKASGPVAVEVPLLFEARFDRFFDLIIFIHAPRKEREQRALRRGMSQKLFRSLDDRQWSPAIKKKLADLVLINRDKDRLKKEAKVLAKALWNG